MTDQARLEPLESGLAPVTDGWFVVNARDAAWQAHPKFGARCTWELGRRVLGDRTDLEPRPFPQVGVNLDVFWPGQPSSLYHAETEQEDFLVRVRRDPRGRGAAAAGLGLRALPARHPPRVRRSGRRAVRHPHARRPPQPRHRLPALGGRAQARGRRGDPHALAGRGLRPAQELGAGPAAGLARAAVGRRVTGLVRPPRARSAACPGHARRPRAPGTRR